jgi:integrase
MMRIDPNQIEMALLPVGTMTFAAVIQKLEGDNRLNDTRRRDLVSGLHKAAKALGRPTSEVLADPQWLQPRLVNIAPANLEITQKSWQNTVSDVKAALAQVGIIKRRNRHIDDLQSSWRDLWLKVLSSGNRTLTTGLGRFIHFVSNLDVAPGAVTHSHAEAFLEALKAEEIAKKPEVSWRNALNAWNIAVTSIDGWPDIRLVPPKRQNVIVRPDDALPKAFVSDLSRVMKFMTQPDPFSEAGPVHAIADTTANHRSRMLKRFASELLNDGVPETQITSVADLCNPILAKRGLQAMYVRNGNQTGSVIDDMAKILQACARRIGIGDKECSALADLSKRVALPTLRGMTRKNRDRLRILRDRATLLRLLDLPDKLLAAGRKRSPKAAALAREDALAIAMLLVCPLRIGNLAEIRVDHHFQRPGDGRVFLVFAEEEVKNGRPIEFELPTDLCRVLNKHLETRSPLLCPSGTPWLFPRRDGTGPVDRGTLSTRIKQRIHKETGVVMNAHLFRHLAAMLYLEAKPGAYEAVRRLLGHSSVSKTISVYTGLETGGVIESFGEVLRAKKGGK